MTDASVSGEELYEQVWNEPMTKVAIRYNVSSSFLARVCERLNVPRPTRSYWAQLEVGKAPARAAKQVEGFFDDAERRAGKLEFEERRMLLDRVQRARELLGGVDALQHFGAWKAPDERGSEAL